MSEAGEEAKQRRLSTILSNKKRTDLAGLLRAQREGTLEQYLQAELERSGLAGSTSSSEPPVPPPHSEHSRSQSTNSLSVPKPNPAEPTQPNSVSARYTPSAAPATVPSVVPASFLERRKSAPEWTSRNSGASDLEIPTMRQENNVSTGFSSQVPSDESVQFKSEVPSAETNDRASALAETTERLSVKDLASRYNSAAVMAPAVQTGSERSETGLTKRLSVKEMARSIERSEDNTIATEAPLRRPSVRKLAERFSSEPVRLHENSTPVDSITPVRPKTQQDAPTAPIPATSSPPEAHIQNHSLQDFTSDTSSRVDSAVASAHITEHAAPVHHDPAPEHKPSLFQSKPPLAVPPSTTRVLDLDSTGNSSNRVDSVVASAPKTEPVAAVSEYRVQLHKLKPSMEAPPSDTVLDSTGNSSNPVDYVVASAPIIEPVAPVDENPVPVHNPATIQPELSMEAPSSTTHVLDLDSTDNSSNPVDSLEASAPITEPSAPVGEDPAPVHKPSLFQSEPSQSTTRVLDLDSTDNSCTPVDSLVTSAPITEPIAPAGENSVPFHKPSPIHTELSLQASSSTSRVMDSDSTGNSSNPVDSLVASAPITEPSAPVGENPVLVHKPSSIQPGPAPASNSRVLESPFSPRPTVPGFLLSPRDPETARHSHAQPVAQSRSVSHVSNQATQQTSTKLEALDPSILNGYHPPDTSTLPALAAQKLFVVHIGDSEPTCNPAYSEDVRMPSPWMDNVPLHVWLEEIQMGQYTPLFEEREAIFDLDTVKRTWLDPRTRLTQARLIELGIVPEHAAAIYSHMKDCFGDDIKPWLQILNLGHIAAALQRSNMTTIEALLSTVRRTEARLNGTKLRQMGVDDASVEKFLSAYEEILCEEVREPVAPKNACCAIS